MRELTFIGPLSGPNIGTGRLDSGETKKLLLIAEDGTEFQLKVDQRLASVVAREFNSSAGESVQSSGSRIPGSSAASDTIDLTSSGNTVGSSAGTPSLRPSVAGAQPISPREIQNRVRAGDTAAEIAQETGSDLAYVERFASQVLAECEQVIASAASCEVTHEGSRQSFDQAVTKRLRILGVTPESVTWHALKAGHDWSVVLSYETSKEEAEAWFDYSLARRVISPSNEEAQWLLAQPHHQEPESTLASPVTTRATIHQPVNTPSTQTATSLSEPTNNTRLAQQSLSPSKNEAPESAIESAATQHPSSLTSSLEESDQWDSEHPAAKALKRREAAAANRNNEPAKAPTAAMSHARPQSYIDVSTPPNTEVIDATDVASQAASMDETAQTSPEWEDLLFGTPSSEGQDS